jgi:5'-AMP-activated protein kinase regulatory beta subunit
MPIQVYGTSYPDLEEYSVKEPPPLPPHLRHIILNKVVSCLSLRATTGIASFVR